MKFLWAKFIAALSYPMTFDTRMKPAGLEGTMKDTEARLTKLGRDVGPHNSAYTPMCLI